MNEPEFVSQSNLTVSELIQFYEDSIECLNSKLLFYRKRLRILRSLDDSKAEPITSEEESHV